MRTRLSLACILGSMLIGCGGPSGLKPSRQEAEQGTMGEVGDMYRLTIVANKKPPASFADFAPSRPLLPRGYDAVQSGRIVVRYGANMTALEEGPPPGESDEVIAYEKQVPESGGQVLMLNRSVKTMTADEFKAAKKAGK